MSLHPLAQIGKQPEGAIGAAMAAYMDQINSQVQSRAVAMLRRIPCHHLLEIGFGGGGLAAKLEVTGMVQRYLGVEVSETLVTQFNQIQGKGKGDQWRAIHASVEIMPVRSGQFDVAVAMNTIYWWRDPATALKEIRRVLRPDGYLIIGMVPKPIAPPVGFGEPGGPVHYDEDELAEMVRAAGFCPVEIENITEKMNINGAGTRDYVIGLAEVV